MSIPAAAAAAIGVQKKLCSYKKCSLSREVEEQKLQILYGIFLSSTCRVGRDFSSLQPQRTVSLEKVIFAPLLSRASCVIVPQLNNNVSYWAQPAVYDYKAIARIYTYIATRQALSELEIEN